MTVMAYRTQDHMADFGFSLEYQSDIGWRYISSFTITGQTINPVDFPTNRSTVTGVITSTGTDESVA